MTMKRILFLATALAFASCVQQKVVTPSPAVLPVAPAVVAPAAQSVKTAAPAAKPKHAPKPTPQPKLIPAPQPKPAVPAPTPLKPLRGTHSTIIQESDKVQTSRSMGGSATYDR